MAYLKWKTIFCDPLDVCVSKEVVNRTYYENMLIDKLDSILRRIGSISFMTPRSKNTMIYRYTIFTR